MDDDMQDMHDQTFKPKVEPRKKLNYYDSGVLNDIRTGFGHLVQVPADIADRQTMRNYFPETLETVKSASANVGNAIAGRELGDSSPLDVLLGAIREQIRYGGLLDPADEVRRR